MRDECTRAAVLLGLHNKAIQVQPRIHIAGNKRVTSVHLTARKEQKLLHTDLPLSIQCAATIPLLNISPALFKVIREACVSHKRRNPWHKML